MVCGNLFWKVRVKLNKGGHLSTFHFKKQKFRELLSKQDAQALSLPHAFPECPESFESHLEMKVTVLTLASCDNITFNYDS